MHEIETMPKDLGHYFAEYSLGETFKEVSTSIAKYLWLYDYYAINGGFDYVDHMLSIL